MRIQLAVLLCVFFCTNQSAFAVDDKAMQELFKKYELAMSGKTELIDDIFTEDFIKSSGGKTEFISKIKYLVAKRKKKPIKVQMTWDKSLSGKMIIAKVKSVSEEKSKQPSEATDFVVIEEKNKLKIDRTMSDAN